MTIAKNIPRLVIAAPQGRSGKTTITIGLLGALKKQGYRVQPFKKGPDYIDPSWLSAAAGRTCRNLDSFLLDDEDIKRSLIQAASDAHLAVVEGAMGFYDGMDLEGNGSTAQIAKKIEAPVLLVLDCQRMSRSAAALVMGFQKFDPEIRIAGVILNNVSRPRHRARLVESIAKYCHIPVVGFLPRDGNLTIPGRHLGLMSAGESEELEDFFSRLSCLVEDNFDLDEILSIAGQAFPLELKDTGEPFPLVSQFPPSIGVIRDQAFNFYYPENLEALEKAGASLCYLNSMGDANLPELDGLLIGGGQPEIFAARLAENKVFREQLSREIEKGLPVYAEGGGLLYLSRGIDVDGNRYPMVGALPFEVSLDSKPRGHGYTVMETVLSNPYFSKGSLVKGHEFHRSRLRNLDHELVEFAFRVKRGHGFDKNADGLIYKNVFASFTHIHALSQPEWAVRLVAAARSYKQKKKEGFIYSTSNWRGVI